MQVQLLALACLSALLAALCWAPAANPRERLEPGRVQAFQLWAGRFAKAYRSPSEREHRLRVFLSTLQRVERHNAAAGRTFEMGLNEYSDVEAEEFLARHHARNMGVDAPQQQGLSAERVSRLPSGSGLGEMNSPESVDWTKTKATFPVRRIGSCGACYAVSSVEAVEGALFFERGVSLELSVQNILDCTSRPPYKNGGCEGGSVLESFSYIQSAGVALAADYPFVSHKTGITTMCQSEKPGKQRIANFYQVVQGRSDILRTLLAYRPISVKINFPDELRNYKSGVFMGESCSTVPNHFVTLVGYGQQTNPDTKLATKFWILKNNLGPTWGEDGYIRILRTDEPVAAVCAITESASFASL